MLSAGAATGQTVKPANAVPVSHTTCCEDSSAHMGQMDVHMKRMQEMHVKLGTATAPEERQKLMEDQRREMQQAMAMMQAVPHSGSVMGAAGADMKGHTGKPADQKTQMQMMEHRMDMMQAMMQTMMDQQSGPMPAPAK